MHQRYSKDAMAGTWWVTRKAGDIDQAHPASCADVIAKNPDATISIDNGASSGNTIPADESTAGVDNVLVGFGG